MRIVSLALLLFAIAAAPSTLAAQQQPTPETAAWWAQTTALSNDAMEGRDTGTEAYERAAKYVADQFAAAGLKPAGDPAPDGKASFFQRVPMHQTSLDTASSSIEIVTPDAPGSPVGGTLHVVPLKLLEEVTLTPRQHSSYQGVAPMIFLGYGLALPPRQTADVKAYDGAVAVYFNNTPAGLTPAERASFLARRTKLLAESSFSATVSIDNPAAIEPAHWPVAYARSVVIQAPGAYPAPSPLPPARSLPLAMRVSAEAAAKLFSAIQEHPYSILLANEEQGRPLPSFRMNAGLRFAARNSEKDISSPNILAILPGSDPSLAPEYVALSAHLDGYGFGTAVLGDTLYNGTLDDAAYVALLIEIARNLHAKAPARSLLFCIFTGEEKGLLGSAWFTAHPTVPPASIVADLNLDQLRPIFPLKILTMEGLADSTLGAAVKQLAAEFRIEIRTDREPERNLYRRADNYNFVRIGVPIASFIFGYNPGSLEERTYRDWYARRYHKPQDDLATPIDWPAAATFNRFYQQLAVNIANAPERPAWLPSSPNAPQSAQKSTTTSPRVP